MTTIQSGGAEFISPKENNQLRQSDVNVPPEILKTNAASRKTLNPDSTTSTISIQQRPNSRISAPTEAVITTNKEIETKTKEIVYVTYTNSTATFKRDLLNTAVTFEKQLSKELDTAVTEKNKVTEEMNNTQAELDKFVDDLRELATDDIDKEIEIKQGIVDTSILIKKQEGEIEQLDKTIKERNEQLPSQRGEVKKLANELIEKELKDLDNEKINPRNSNEKIKELDEKKNILNNYQLFVNEFEYDNEIFKSTLEKLSNGRLTDQLDPSKKSRVSAQDFRKFIGNLTTAARREIGNIIPLARSLKDDILGTFLGTTALKKEIKEVEQEIIAEWEKNIKSLEDGIAEEPKELSDQEIIAEWEKYIENLDDGIAKEAAIEHLIELKSDLIDKEYEILKNKLENDREDFIPETTTAIDSSANNAADITKLTKESTSPVETGDKFEDLMRELTKEVESIEEKEKASLDFQKLYKEVRTEENKTNRPEWFSLQAAILNRLQAVAQGGVDFNKMLELDNKINIAQKAYDLAIKMNNEISEYSKLRKELDTAKEDKDTPPEWLDLQEAKMNKLFAVIKDNPIKTISSLDEKVNTAQKAYDNLLLERENKSEFEKEKAYAEYEKLYKELVIEQENKNRPAEWFTLQEARIKKQAELSKGTNSELIKELDNKIAIAQKAYDAL